MNSYKKFYPKDSSSILKIRSIGKIWPLLLDLSKRLNIIIKVYLFNQWLNRSSEEESGQKLGYNLYS